ncbi:hypothetical protein GGR56DRAFT_658307 [Xylariaceae sp. FL0804]|nr:hypothetical protein GGR56DRAFT_658307 [Xylariaceae sp. FL0804]
MAAAHSLFTNRFFVFVVGAEKTKFHVHADVFAKLSPALDSLINGSFAEAKDMRAVWDDTEPKDFEHLLSYAYSGDYEVAVSEYRPGQKAVQSDGSLPYIVGRLVTLFTWNRSYNQVRQTGKLIMANEFENERAKLRLRVPKKLHNNDECLQAGFNGASMSHARIYRLAEKYGIEQLKQVACWKLSNALTDTVIEKEIGSIDGFGDLVRYVFENTPRDDDPARWQLVRFAAVIAYDVRDDPVFKQVLLDVPEFSGMLVHMLAAHLLV